jgi:hydrogen peroxide-dependent heme synthase
MTSGNVTVPETLEGWAVLHQIFRVDWPAWKRGSAEEKRRAVSEAEEFLRKIAAPAEGGSAFYSVLGHKGDLLFLHFRKTFDQLNAVELAFRKLSVADHLIDVTSHVSFVELGMYEMTVKLAEKFAADGLKTEGEEWGKRMAAEMEVQRERVKGRLFTAIPEERYLCFYPMNKRRGETHNWYSLPIEERQRMMRDHGMVGRKYGDRVTQVISGSIASDDWEWGVDLFANDPLVFKKLIYEMRFDEASARYAEFGPFVTGIRLAPEGLGDLLSGKLPGEER